MDGHPCPPTKHVSTINTRRIITKKPSKRSYGRASSDGFSLYLLSSTILLFEGLKCLVKVGYATCFIFDGGDLAILARAGKRKNITLECASGGSFLHKVLHGQRDILAAVGSGERSILVDWLAVLDCGRAPESIDLSIRFRPLEKAYTIVSCTNVAINRLGCWRWRWRCLLLLGWS